MTLRLYFSAASPFVRKVMVCAHEKKVADQVEKLASQAWPVKRDPTIVRDNPSGQVPTALLDDGSPLFDSRVICAYVDTMSGEGGLYPASGEARFRVLTVEALADSALAAALLCRYETVLRPEELRWQLWSDSQMEKIDSSLDDLETRWIDHLAAGAAETVDAGSVAVACALGYLDFRFADKDWRSARPKLAAWFAAFAARPSMQATMPS